MKNDEKMLENITHYINIVHINKALVKLFRNAVKKFRRAAAKGKRNIESCFIYKSVI